MSKIVNIRFSKWCKSDKMGYKNDTFAMANKRLLETMETGFIPFAMVYRDESGERDPAWASFAWPWSRPAAMSKKYRAFEKVYP